MEDDYIPRKKVIIIGESASGKTCLLLRLLKDTFNEYENASIGASFQTKTFKVDGNKEVDVCLWDTCGQETFKSVVRQYMRASDCVIVVFDISRNETFDGLDYWVVQAKELLGSSIPIIIVASKIDLTHIVDMNEVEKYCSQNHFPLFKVSSKTGENVSELFQHAAELAYQYGLVIETPSSDGIITLNNSDESSERKSKCC